MDFDLAVIIRYFDGSNRHNKYKIKNTALRSALQIRNIYDPGIHTIIALK